MDDMDEFQLSDSEASDENVEDLYGDDPVFESKEELDEFMAGCDLGRKKSEKENADNVCFEDIESIK